MVDVFGVYLPPLFRLFLVLLFDFLSYIWMYVYPQFLVACPIWMVVCLHVGLHVTFGMLILCMFDCSFECMFGCTWMFVHLDGQFKWLPICLCVSVEQLIVPVCLSASFECLISMGFPMDSQVYGLDGWFYRLDGKFY